MEHQAVPLAFRITAREGCVPEGIRPTSVQLQLNDTGLDRA